MNKEEKITYKKINTPIVTHMCNLMQWVYSDPQIRGAADEISMEGKEHKVAPLFSALQAFIISSAMCMRKPDEEKIEIPSHDEIMRNMDRIIALLETFFKQPIRTSLVAGLEKFIINGQFDTKPIPDEHAEKLFGRKAN
jgi:hypothetical protein